MYALELEVVEEPLYIVKRESKGVDLFWTIFHESNGYDTQDFIHKIEELGEIFLNNGVSKYEQKILTAEACSTDNLAANYAVEILSQFLKPDDSRVSMATVCKLSTGQGRTRARENAYTCIKNDPIIGPVDEALMPFVIEDIINRNNDFIGEVEGILETKLLEEIPA